jgi:hypothetical protein
MFSPSQDASGREARQMILAVGENPAICALLCLHLRSKGYDAAPVSSDKAVKPQEDLTPCDIMIAYDLGERQLSGLLAKFSSSGRMPRLIAIRQNRIHALSHADGPSRRLLDLLGELGFTCSSRLHNALLLTAA